MSVTTRGSVIAAVAALALSGSMVGSTAPADAHTYKKEGTVSAKEANKLFKEAFRQKCLTVHEAQHIVHGSGEVTSYWTGEEDKFTTYLQVNGTKRSHIRFVEVSFDGDSSGECAIGADAYER